MSTTHVQSLPNVRGRMSYTEFGEGKRRREHLENGTDRIAAQMGDAASREDFIVYCEGQKRRHPNAVNEGYEVRISWATDELDPSRQDDIQRGMEYAYTLCHELAPDSMCWVTMHVDGEGGCPRDHREPRCPFGTSHQQGGHQSVRPARAGGERQAEPRERLPGARGGQGDVHMGAAPRRIRL